MTRISRLVAVCAVALLVGLSLVPLGASGRAEARPPTPGKPWPGKKIHTITYVDKTLDAASVRYAVRAWNRSGVNVRFKKAKRVRGADLVIRNSKRVPGGCGTGLAQLGYVPGRTAFVNILHGDGSQGCAFPGQTLVLAHELGHVLGLGHTDRRCSLMNTSHTNGVAPSACLGDDISLAKPGRWYCGLFAPGDLKAAARLYGGKPRKPDAEYCDAIERIPAAGPVSASVDQFGRLTLGLTRAVEPPVPSWLGTWGLGAPGFEVHAVPGACVAAAAPGDQATEVSTRTWTVPVGGVETVPPSGLPPGPVCITVWQFDQGENYSLVPAQAQVEVPAASPARGTDDGPAPERETPVKVFALR